MNPNITRGLHNNNPLNIRKSSVKWVGEVDGTDPDFCTFSDIFYGCRAALINLRSHINQDTRRLIRTTVGSEITRWAPPIENDTRAYINSVCAQIGMKADQRIVFSDKHLVCQFLWAMAKHECGASADIHLYWFERAYAMV